MQCRVRSACYVMSVFVLWCQCVVLGAGGWSKEERITRDKTMTRRGYVAKGIG